MFRKYVPLPTGDELEFNGADSLNTLWGRLTISSAIEACIHPPLTDAVSEGHFKKDFEQYTSGLENSQVHTLVELVDFNRKHSEKELPPRQCFTVDILVCSY